MKRLLLISVLLLNLLIGTPAFSADFQKGLKAYQLGDYTTVLKEWKPLAEEGHANSQVNLGVMYLEGKGIPQNDETAIKWLTFAAEQGHIESQYYVKKIGKPTQSEKL